MTGDGRRQRCACGCGGWTSGTWVRGHDQSALHEMVSGLGFANVATMYRAYIDGRISTAPDLSGGLPIPAQPIPTIRRDRRPINKGRA